MLLIPDLQQITLYHTIPSIYLGVKDNELTAILPTKDLQHGKRILLSVLSIINMYLDTPLNIEDTIVIPMGIDSTPKTTFLHLDAWLGIQLGGLRSVVVFGFDSTMYPVPQSVGDELNNVLLAATTKSASRHAYHIAEPSERQRSCGCTTCDALEEAERKIIRILLQSRKGGTPLLDYEF